MSPCIRPFRMIEEGARFRYEGIEYQKCGPAMAYPIMDSDEPDDYIFLGSEPCVTRVDPRTGKKSL